MLSLRNRAVAAALAALMVAGAGLALAAPAQAVVYSVSGTVTIPADAPEAWLRGVVVRAFDAQGEEIAYKAVGSTTGAYTLTLP